MANIRSINDPDDIIAPTSPAKPLGNIVDANLELVKMQLINLGGFIIGKRTLGKGTDSLDKEISRINDGLIAGFGSLGGVLTKSDHQKLQDKIQIAKDNPSANDDQYLQATLARIRLVNLQELNKQQQIQDTIKEYGFDPSKIAENEEDLKRLKAQSLRGQMTSAVVQLNHEAQKPLDQNNSAMLGRVFCFAITCGGFEALDLISNFIDCFMNADFKTGVENVMSNSNVVGPGAEIANATKIDVVAAEISNNIPIVSDINQFAVEAMNTSIGSNAVEGFQAIITSDSAKYALIAGALAYQVVTELNINSEFNKSIKEIKGKVDEFRDKIRQDVSDYYDEAAQKLADKKEFGLALKEFELKQFIEKYKTLDNFFSPTINSDNGQNFKSKFDDISIKTANGETNIIDYVRGRALDDPSASMQKIFHDVVSILSQDSDDLKKFMIAVSQSLTNDQKLEARKELMAEVLQGQDISKLSSLSQFLPADPMLPKPTLTELFDQIYAHSIDSGDRVLRALVVEVKKAEVRSDIEVGDSYFEKIDFSNLSKPQNNVIDSTGSQAIAGSQSAANSLLSAWDGDDSQYPSPPPAPASPPPPPAPASPSRRGSADEPTLPPSPAPSPAPSPRDAQPVSRSTSRGPDPAAGVGFSR